MIFATTRGGRATFFIDECSGQNFHGQLETFMHNRSATPERVAGLVSVSCPGRRR